MAGPGGVVYQLQLSLAPAEIEFLAAAEIVVYSIVYVCVIADAYAFIRIAHGSNLDYCTYRGIVLCARVRNHLNALYLLGFQPIQLIGIVHLTVVYVDQRGAFGCHGYFSAAVYPHPWHLP